jgi:hypothetical protein
VADDVPFGAVQLTHQLHVQYSTTMFMLSDCTVDILDIFLAETDQRTIQMIHTASAIMTFFQHLQVIEILPENRKTQSKPIIPSNYCKV